MRLRSLVAVVAVAGAVASAGYGCGSTISKGGGMGGSWGGRDAGRMGGRVGGADSSSSIGGARGTRPAVGRIDTVYVISLENTDWADGNTEAQGRFYKNNPAAPFINNTLLPKYAHAERYHTPYHPSEPNYLSYESGGESFGVTSSPLPFKYNGGCRALKGVVNPPPNGTVDCGDGFFRPPEGTPHISKLLHAAGKSWKYYFGAIPGNGTICPNTDKTPGYSADHNANIFFDDVVTNDVSLVTLMPDSPTLQYCRGHLRPLSELIGDLRGGKENAYNFIIPTDQDQGEKCPVEMSACSTTDRIKHTDAYLMTLVSGIWDNSAAWQRGTAIIFVVWDEPDSNNNTDPCGMIVIAPKAKPGFASMTDFPNGHASLVKTILEIFGLPLIGKTTDPAIKDLSEMLTSFP
jgi:phosphatidylinositol-3-phosphatase